jgi:hypothetical protein
MPGVLFTGNAFLRQVSCCYSEIQELQPLAASGSDDGDESGSTRDAYTRKMAPFHSYFGDSTSD